MHNRIPINIFLFTLFFGWNCTILFSQAYCQDILKKAETSYQNGKLEKAMLQLQDAETCDYKNDLQESRQILQNNIFKKINESKKNAIAEKKKSDRLLHSSKNVLRILQLRDLNANLALRMAKLNYLLFPEIRSACGILNELNNNSDYIKILKTIKKGHDLGVSSVAFAPNGDLILTGSWDKTAKLWDFSGKELKSFQGHSSEITSVAFAPNGKTILTGSNDNTAKLWDFSGKELRSFQGHSSSVHAVAFSPDGQYVLTGSDDMTAKLWDLMGNELLAFQGHSWYILAVAFAPDGKTILTGSSDRTAKLWNLTGNELRSFQGHSSSILSVAFSPDGQTILTGSRDKTAKLWDLTGNELRSFQGHSSSILSVAFSPDGQTILTGSRDKTAKLWDLTGNELRSFQGHNSEITSVAFAPDSKTILTGSRDKTAKLWDLQGNLLQNYQPSVQANNSNVYAVAISPNGKKILTGTRDGTTKLFDLSGNELQSFKKHSGAVTAVAFSPDGKTILTGATDSTAKLCNLKGDELQNFKGHTNEIYAVAYSPDGKTVLTGAYDQSTKLWDLEGNELHNFCGHITEVYNAIFSTNKKKDSINLNGNLSGLWFKLWLKLNQDMKTYSMEEAKSLGLSFEKEDWERATYLFNYINFGFKKFLDLKSEKDLSISGDHFYGREEWEKAKKLYEKAQQINATANTQIKLYEISVEQGKPLGIVHSLDRFSIDDIKVFIEYFRPKDTDIKRKKEYLKKYKMLHSFMSHAIYLGIDSTTQEQFARHYNNFSYFQLLNRDFVGAGKSAYQGLELDSTNVPFLHAKLAPIFLFQGKYKIAQREFEKWAAQPYDSTFPNYAAKFLNYFRLFEAEKVIPEAHRAKMEEIKLYLQKVVKEAK